MLLGCMLTAENVEEDGAKDLLTNFGLVSPGFAAG